MTKQSVQFHEFNILMGNKIYLPNVTGMLQAFAETIPSVVSAYRFAPFLFVRNDPAKIMEQWPKDLSVLAFSSSMWNHELNLFLALEARSVFPESLIVFGGPHVQTSPEEFLTKHSFVDVVVIGEGEVTFSEILTTFSERGKDFSNVPGLVYRSAKGLPLRTENRGMVDINTLPSPYLDGLYDEILKNQNGIEYQIILETNRGCPFHCSFCYWGNGITRVRNFDMKRILSEIDWLSQNRIPYVFGADANFGMFPRDLTIAKKFVDVKSSTGWPGSFRVCYGKNAVDRVFETAQLLDGSDLTKGVTVSFQSLDPKTLRLVGRKNIKLEAYRQLLRQYRQADIRVYTELILGLPGETYESFSSGLEEIFQAGMHDQVSIFFCQALPGTEITDPDYIQEHQIETCRIELVEIHSLRRQPGEVVEYEDIIVSTASMSVNDWRKMATLSWAAQSLHGLKLGFFVALYLFDKFGLKYTELFEYLIKKAENSSDFPEIFQELQFFKKYLNGIFEGHPQCVFLPEFGEISWQIEEATFLRLNYRLAEFYSELERIVRDLCLEKDLGCDLDELHEVFVYQRAIIASFDSQETRVEFSRNIPEYFEGFRRDRPVEITHSEQILLVKPVSFTNKVEFAQMVIWFGRRDSRTVRESSWIPLE